MNAATLRARAREAGGGVIAAVVTLATPLTLGLLAYATLGPRAVEVGLPAAFVTVAVGGLVVALLGRSAVPAGGLSSATALILAGIVAELAADPQLQLDQPGHLALLVSVVSCSVLGMGLLQMLFGLLRLGSLARFVPQPVLAGFMNGVALMIFWAQLPALLGLAGPGPGWSALQPATALVGLGSAVTMWLVAWRAPRAPAALVGLAVGCALYAAIHALLPQATLGPLAGTLPSGLPTPDVLRPLWQGGAALALLQRHAEGVATAAGLLAIIGSLETVLYARAMDIDLHTRHDPNRELLAFGAGNVVVALFGGLPLVYWRSRAQSLLRLAGRSRLAVGVAAVANGALLLLGGPLIALLPLSVLAGLMVVVAWALVDGWTRRLLQHGLAGNRTGELWLNLAIVAVVCGVTVWIGFVAGVAVGLLLAMALFIRSMQHSLIRSHLSGAARPSRRVYPARQEALLAPARQQIVLLELEGALFFGNADRLLSQVERMDPSCRFLVLDLKRISTIDASGAMALSQLLAAARQRGRRLLLAGLAADHPHGHTLRALSTSAAGADWYADADQAVEAAERQLLHEAGHGTGDAELPLADCSLMQGLDARQQALVQAALQSRTLAADELLFRQGDPGDCLYVLTRGSITVLSRNDEGRRLSQRYVSFSPGMMLGEIAMLDGQGRTADAVADELSVVHALSRDALATLRSADPTTSEQITLNIARHLSERLRHAASAWRASA